MQLLNNIKRFSHTIETKIQYNQYQRKQLFDALIAKKQDSRYSGSYDKTGSDSYKIKNSHQGYKSFITNPSLQLSSIGVGTYKGSLDQTDDLPMFNGLVDSLDYGCNHIDTCRNFRGGRSQKVVGLALRHLVEGLGYQRNNFFIGSKVGYVRDNLPQDVSRNEVINSHCVNPKFLEAQLQRSLQNIGVNTLDVYYLNNFAESQMAQLQTSQFDQKLSKAFEFFQTARQNKKIKYYGISSWQCFRMSKGQKGHLDLQKVHKIAEKIGGKEHGFRFVQLPVNIMMPQAFAEKYSEDKSFLDLTDQLKINVVSNSPLFSGSLINIPMPANLLKCNYNGAKHLQLIRSIPSRSLLSTLIGHKLNRHVKKNLEVLTAPPLDETEWLNIFVPNSQQKLVQLQERQSL